MPDAGHSRKQARKMLPVPPAGSVFISRIVYDLLWEVKSAGRAEGQASGESVFPVDQAAGRCEAARGGVRFHFVGKTKSNEPRFDAANI